MQLDDKIIVESPMFGRRPLNVEESRAFRRAQQNGFLRVRSQSRRAGFAWSIWCYQNGHPVVVVTRRLRLAHIWVDLHPANKIFSPSARDVVGKAFKRCGALKWSCAADVAEATVNREVAEPLAQIFLDIALGRRCVG